jgi:hypothetical protein
MSESGSPSDAKPVGKNKTTPNAQGKANIKTGHSNPHIPTILSVPSSPPPEPHYEVACKTEKDWRDKTKFYFEIGGIVLLGVYTLYTIKMYGTNEEASGAAKSAAETAAKQLELAQRPWVSFESINIIGPFTFDANGARA